MAHRWPQEMRSLKPIAAAWRQDRGFLSRQVHVFRRAGTPPISISRMSPRWSQARLPAR